MAKTKLLESHYSCIWNTLYGRLYCCYQLLDHFLKRGGHPCSLPYDMRCLTAGTLHISTPSPGLMWASRMWEKWQRKKRKSSYAFWLRALRLWLHSVYKIMAARPLPSRQYLKILLWGIWQNQKGSSKETNIRASQQTCRPKSHHVKAQNLQRSTKAWRALHHKQPELSDIQRMH